MKTDNAYCEKYCKGYRDTGGKCFVDERCNAYLEYQKQKDLLLKDLCVRIRCGVKVILPEIRKDIATLVGISDTCYIVAYDNSIINCPFEIEIKPYLRPMSSMTEEENEIVANISNKGKGFVEDEDGWIRCDSIHTKWGVCPDGCANLLDYLNSIHIDYRGLIPMGLALEAPKDMYYETL